MCKEPADETRSRLFVRCRLQLSQPPASFAGRQLPIRLCPIVAARLLSGLEVAKLTALPCCKASPTNEPCTSQSFAVVSEDAVTIRLPSALKAADLTSFWCCNVNNSVVFSQSQTCAILSAHAV